LNSNETKIGKTKVNEIIAGLIFGTSAGASVAIFALFVSNTLLLLFLLGNNTLISPIIIAWVIITISWLIPAMISALYYKPFPWAIYRNLAFAIGLLITAGSMNYIYNILVHTHNISFLYSSWESVWIVTLIVIGSTIGLVIKEEKENKEIAQ